MRGLGDRCVSARSGSLKERRSRSRTMRAVQVLGAYVIVRGAGSGFQTKLLVGSSVPEQGIDDHDIPILYQRSNAWSEGTFESGFEFRGERCSAVLRDMEKETDGMEDDEGANSDLNVPRRSKKNSPSYGSEL